MELGDSEALGRGERPDLRSFQTWMQTFIVAPGTPEEALSAAEEASGFSEGSAERLVLPSATLSEMERLMIYRRMFPLRMEEALSIDFPASRQMVGSRRFFALVMEYVEAYPSRSWTLEHLGWGMVEFVRGHRLAEEFPGLYDMVRLEQALCEVYGELDSAVLTAEEMAAVPGEVWAEVRLDCVPALRLLQLDSNANDAFKAHVMGEELPDWVGGPHYVVIWRGDFQTWRMPLEPAAYHLLDRLREGVALGEALGGAMDLFGLEDEGQVFGWFQTWVGEGFFQALQLPEPMPAADSVSPL